MKTARRLLLLGTALLLSGGVTACDGANCFEPGGCGIRPDTTTTGTPTVDAAAPSVTFVVPVDSTLAAVGDSLFVSVRATDDRQLQSLQLEGFVMRGDPNLTTPQRVDRFATKSVALGRAATGRAVRDTTINRWLIATSDSLPERGIFVVATVADSAGNSRSDTIRVALGGPRIAIASPAARTEYKGNTVIPVRLVAEDRNDLIASVRLRASGAFTRDTTVTLRVPVAVVDTTIVLLVPNITQEGGLRLEASATSGARLPGISAPVDLLIAPSGVDALAPRVSFTLTGPARAEARDTLTVDVQATDETRVDSAGATVVAIRRGATRDDTLAVVRRGVSAASGRLRFVLEEFATAAVPFNGLDTVNVAFEVTAWAKDPARNCGAAVSPGVIQSLPCRMAAGATVSDGPGTLQNVLLTRGATIPPPNAGDRIADMVADGNRLFLSNLTRNRVEVLPVGATTYASPVLVGSEPWGLAIGRTGDTLFVANSGGTNVSLIPLRDAALQEAESKRILTRNERAFSVSYDAATGRVSNVTLFDYSDRPQFIGQASNGLLVYSTRPSAAATDGTVRIFDGVKRREEIFTGYVTRDFAGKAIVVNADSAFLVVGGGLLVCPRRPYGVTEQPGCIFGSPYSVEDSLRTLRALPRNPSGGKYDARVDLGADIEQLGFADTTFVATSGDRNYVAVGEGVRSNARIPMFRVGGDSLVMVGDVRDLISNASERVIGLGINRDGSLGVARGDYAYYFTEALRLQGRVQSGSPAGGVAMHPSNANYPIGADRLSFVSGVDALGPYVDVIDSFNFSHVKRLYVRDPVVGALVVAPRAATDPASVVLRLYALTSRGVIGLRLTTADLTR